MFGATISAVIAVIAAAIAIGYHENVVNAFLGGAMGDYANAGALVALFAGVYVICRTITDRAIPGNIRLPLAIDRVGGAVMGIVAAIFTAGIVALAAQALPFGVAAGGHSRFAVEGTREVAIFPPGASRSVDMEVRDQLDEDRFQDEKRAKLWVPADDMVLGFVQKLSDGGSLAGARTLNSIHPNYVDELFATRLGVQVGAKRTAFNGGKTPQVTVPEPGVFVIVTPDLTAKGNFIDAELNDLHQREVVPKKSGNEIQLVVRVMFGKDAADADTNVRLAPASVRLVANGTNYFPVGTLENGQLYANKVDDYLFVNVKGADAGADFVFFVPGNEIASNNSAFNPKEAASASKDPKDAPKVKDGVFVEVKRLARVALGGRPILTSVPKAENIAVERKPKLLEDKKKNVPAAGETPPPAAEATPAPADAKKNPMQAIKENTAQKNELINKGP
jgi:hypothetical protein